MSTLTTTSVHLIGFGSCHAIPASELQPGDMIVYNYGIVGEVAAVERVGAMVRLTTIEGSHHGTYTSRKRATTLVGVTWPAFSRWEQAR